MKKFKFLLLVLLMLVVLTSCKSNKTDGDESKTEPPVAETMVTPMKTKKSKTSLNKTSVF